MAVQPILIYLIPSNKIGEEIPNGETAVTHEKEVYGKIFLYTNVKIIKCQEYPVSQATKGRKSLRCLPHRR